MIATNDDTPLRPICATWLSLIEKSREHRQRKFGDTADLCHRFYTDSYDFLYEKGHKGIAEDSVPSPSFRMTLSKAAELVQLFGPHLYHKNPKRHVLSRRIPLPSQAFMLLYGQDMQQATAVAQSRDQQDAMDELVAELLSHVLNYTPQEFGLKRESMLAIDEALIAGRGFLIHEMARQDENPGLLLPSHYYASWKRCFLDPDATSIKDAKWFVLEFFEPVWSVEREFGLGPGSLKKYARGESTERQAEVDSYSRRDGSWQRDREQTHDSIRYYKIWTKCGMGQRVGAGIYDKERSDLGQLRSVLETFGDYCFLVVADGVPFPLNLPPQVQNANIDTASGDPQAAVNYDDLLRRIRWPIPFYKDNHGWPFSELDLHPVAGDLWPMAHLRPAIGMLEFLSWFYSWQMGRIQFSGRTLIALAAQAGEEIEEQIKHGADLSIVRLQALQRDLKNAVHMMNFPEVNADSWKIAELVSNEFDKATGLSELVYGMSGKQMRSASEAQMRNQAVSTRPDDMSDKTEDWQSMAARREAQMLRWMTPGSAVAQIMREPYQPELQMVGPFATLWDRLVSVPLDYNNPQTLEKVVREFEYTIVSGSARKPNLERDQSNLELSAQTWLPILQQWAVQFGNVEPLNNFAAAYAKTYGMDERLLQLPPPPQPMPQPVPQQGAA